MHYQITFSNLSEQLKEILIAEIQGDADGFEEDTSYLKAIFSQDNFDEGLINSLCKKYNIGYEKEEIKAQNWNALWESNFNPVYVNGFAGIRASFHEPLINVTHEIVITPKMSFGTGHHATTYLMMKEMEDVNFNNKSVFDFGTGTGVLAILAKKLGAKSIVASDIDQWSIENALENFKNNNAKDIRLIQSDKVVTDEYFDVILANINKNVLVENCRSLSNQLNKTGVLLLSGMLNTDCNTVKKLYEKSGLKHIKTAEKNNWICLIFNKL